MIICRILAYYFWILILPLSIPLSIGIYCDWIAGPASFPQPPSALAFLLTILLAALAGCILFLIGRRSSGQLYRKEAILLVLLIYFLTPVFGGLPFFLNETLKSPVDSYFEAVSALTTTGASILYPKKYDPLTGQELPYTKSVETSLKTTYFYYGTVAPLPATADHERLEGLSAVSYSLLFWRSFMQWLGGGGIIVLFVAILPALGMGGKVLFQTEITGPTKETMLPRIKETASHLWKIYLTLTVGEVILLMLTNRKMPFFDALTVSMATLSTGGLSPRNEGIAFYNNACTDWVILVFMILGSINFSIYFFCMRGRFSRLKDPEVKVFLAIILAASLFAAWQLTGRESALIGTDQEGGVLNFGEALRYGAFQIVSAQTSTGFSTANYPLWPFSIQLLMLILMYVGGMAGSTAGGLKVVRLQTFFHIVLNKIESIFRPDTLRTFRIGTSVVDNRTALTILCLIMIALSMTIVGTFALVLDGVDPQTSLTTVASMINNGGLAFAIGGITDSFNFLTPFGKVLSCIWMIAGRLEYYTLLVAFVPAFWRTNY